MQGLLIIMCKRSQKEGRGLMQLADVVAKPLSIICEKSQHSGKDPNDCRKRILRQLLKMAKRRTLGTPDQTTFHYTEGGLKEKLRKAFEQSL